MLEVYESFFAEAMPAEVQRLGIVYTPIELVDFVLRSTDAVLQQEFGRGLSAKNVHILDPFTGTGTFIYRLLTQNNGDREPLIADADLERKFVNTHNPTVPGGTAQEIHANEIVLLAYYLAALKIEEGYRARTGRYEPFSGIVLTDTFEHDPSTLPGTGAIGYNTARAKQQHDLPIQVIVANRLGRLARNHQATTTHDASTPTSSNACATPTANATAKSPAKVQANRREIFMSKRSAGPPIDSNTQQQTNPALLPSFILTRCVTPPASPECEPRYATSSPTFTSSTC